MHAAQDRSGGGAGDDDPREAARAAGLRYVSDSDAGITRLGRGRGFTYRDARGRTVTAQQRRRIEDLAIPPAWTGVWICAQARGHLQATGFDDRGRKQYLYHDRWRRLRTGATFDRLLVVGSALPAVRAEVAAQLRRRTVDTQRMLAAMVRMLDLTGIRVGNETYERENGTVGLCTLRWSHVSLTGDALAVRYTGKSGIGRQFAITDRPLLRLLRQVASGRRNRVFRIDGRSLTPGDLNGYLTEIAGVHVTAKDFRTWRGTAGALGVLLATAPGARPTRRATIEAIDAAAGSLGNTRSVARAHYVHPAIIDAYLAGELPRSSPPIAGLDDTERILMAILASGSASAS